VLGARGERSRRFSPAEVQRRPRPAYAVWEFTLACDRRLVSGGVGGLFDAYTDSDRTGFAPVGATAPPG
jgi:hypothetical protein